MKIRPRVHSGQGWHALNRYWILFLGVLFVCNLSMAQENGNNSASWSGVIINSGCTVDEAFAEAAKCTENVPGAKLVLYDDTIRQIYELEPQTQAAGLLGDSVSVRG